MPDSFIKEVLKDSESQIDRALRFLWYIERVENRDSASITDLIFYFDAARLNRPNPSRLKSDLRAHRFTRKISTDRIALNNHGMDELEKHYGHFVKAITSKDVFDETGLLNFPFMSNSDIDDARTMSGLYIKLFFLENSMRRFIESTLSRKIGSDWWNKSASASMRKKEEARQHNENTNKWIPARANVGPLYALDWNDLITIMRKHESIFAEKLGDINFLHRYSDLVNIRNVIAHNGVMENEANLKRIDVAIHDWQMQLRS